MIAAHARNDLDGISESSSKPCEWTLWRDHLLHSNKQELLAPVYRRRSSLGLVVADSFVLPLQPAVMVKSCE